MFHNIVDKFTEVDDLGCGWVPIKKFDPGAQTERNIFFWPYTKS